MQVFCFGLIEDKSKNGTSSDETCPQLYIIEEYDLSCFSPPKALLYKAPQRGGQA